MLVPVPRLEGPILHFFEDICVKCWSQIAFWGFQLLLNFAEVGTFFGSSSSFQTCLCTSYLQACFYEKTSVPKSILRTGMFEVRAFLRNTKIIGAKLEFACCQQMNVCFKLVISYDLLKPLFFCNRMGFGVAVLFLFFGASLIGH